jgi:predicted CDP-diglyceride synthetase/phosphatidate cytidylyltransferase
MKAPASAGKRSSTLVRKSGHLDQGHLGRRRVLKRLQDLGFDAPVATHAA